MEFLAWANQHHIRLILYFIICELLGIPKIGYYFYNCSKTTHYAQNYLLNCFTVCLLYHSSQQSASGLLFIIFSLQVTPTFFSKLFNQGQHQIRTRICISWVPMRPSKYGVFSVVARTSEKSTRKAGVEVWGWSLRAVQLEKEATFELKLTCM